MAGDHAAAFLKDGIEAAELTVLLANPRGFCAGVERAISIVERALIKFGSPVYVRHEIVHNKRVVEELRNKGAVFVEELDEVPTGAVTIFSAHGVSRLVEDEAQKRTLKVIDATCPLVSKVHIEGRRYADQGYDIILIGHLGHAEVEGTIGQISKPVHVIANEEEARNLKVGNPDKVAFITQTTLSVQDTQSIIAVLRKRFPAIVGPDTKDICYATQNRQTAVREMINEIDLLLVLGAHNSSNSNRLREIGAEEGIESHLLETACALDPSWLNGVERVGLTAGASAPDSIVQETLTRLSQLRQTKIIIKDGVKEDMQFKLPAEIAQI